VGRVPSYKARKYCSEKRPLTLGVAQLERVNSLKECVLGLEVHQQAHFEQPDHQLVPGLSRQVRVCGDKLSWTLWQPHGEENGVACADSGAVSPFSSYPVQLDLFLESLVSGESEEPGCGG